MTLLWEWLGQQLTWVGCRILVIKVYIANMNDKQQFNYIQFAIVCILIYNQLSQPKKMGNSAQKPPLPSALIAKTDARYGGNIYIDNTKTKAYQILDVDESSKQNFTNLLNSRKQLNHPALISVSRTWVQDYRQHCSLQKMYRITMEYMYIPFTLQDEIKKYCEIRTPVPEPLVRKYFSDIVSCLEYLRSGGTCHGDIKPTNILISQSNRAYLADSYFINSGRIAYQIVMEDPQSLSLLSPTQLEHLRNKKFISLKQVHQDQMFAVGLSMMEAMTAEPAMECYDLANLQVRPDFFNRKYTEMIQCQYSPQLAQLVMACVHFNPQQRINFSTFLQSINNIIPSQNLNRNNLPQNNIPNRMPIKNV